MQVSVEPRVRYQIAGDLLSRFGELTFEDLAAAGGLAARINDIRDAARFPESAVKAGELYTAGLLDEIFHLVLESYRERVDPTVLADAIDHLETTIGDDALEALLEGWAFWFPPEPVYVEGRTPADFVAETSEGVPHRHVVLEKLVLLRISNENPGRARFRELFHDAPLATRTAYEQAVAALEGFFAERPGFGGEGGTSLLSMLREPANASPTSLEGQLEYVRANWAGVLGARFADILGKLLLALDVLAEERKPGGFGGAGPPAVLSASDLAGSGEYERFSPDQDWMPRVVMLAKNAFVWLDQLSRWYRRDISTLDAVPDEELDRLAEAGFTGLWLIGVWQRSEASKRIKQMRGDAEAVASAYSLYDYVIAHDLGGDGAYENLHDRAWQRGIRLASDMVPNHIGIDGRWVVEHPDWFLSLPEPPYPAYSYSGADLSGDDRVVIQIEDHYWNGSDATVVFKRYDKASGDTRYIYHGNDGTSMPWNDTAQLDYLNPDAREGVIQTILHVARKFPIIRFDAAMTLASRHIQRLWYPEPGHGGAIPSRAVHAMSAEEFARALPDEFWREVVDRVAAEVPDTLLLAEAFWMLEGYFVRTLGMHRVYNDAFMHMTSNQDNADYRRLMKNTMEFDPEVLKRFVNFMSNPDEETALAQFGKDDKYFGVCTLMATLPGLPMFGHGQLEGFSEKYGMEFRRARTTEDPDGWLMDRHRREIFPLLHRRRQFAEVGEFLLYDCVTGSGEVAEDVYAYSNNVDGARSLVLFNNRYERSEGWIGTSVPFSVPAGGERTILHRHIGYGLALAGGDEDVMVARDHVTGLQHLYRSRAVKDQGFAVSLDGYQRRVLLDIHEVSGRDYLELCDRLAGAGVASITDELDLRRLGPLHDALRAVIDAPGDQVEPAYRAFLTAAGADEGSVRAFLADVAAINRTPRPRLLLAAQQRAHAHRLAGSRSALRAWAALRHIADRTAEWRLDRVVPDHDLVRVLVRHAGWAEEAADAAAALASLLEDDAVRSYLRINTHDGVEWFDGDRFRPMTTALLLVALVQARGKTSKEAYRNAARLTLEIDAIEDAAEYRVDRLAATDQPNDPPSP